jgi:hypothetical protein
MHPQQLEAVQQAAATASWVVMVGQPSLDGLATALESEAPVLLVLPDERAMQELEERWSRPWPEHVELAALLLAAESGEAAWFHYNDPRLNGLVGPDALRATFPNLRLVRTELRPARTLDDLLADWAPAAGTGQGLLVLCDSAGLSLLAGAGPTLRRVKRLVWWPNSVEPDAATTFAGLDAALQEQWLVATAPGIWQHDESLAFRATVQAERDALLHEREQLVQERDALQARANTQQAQLDRINIELDEILALIDQSNQEDQDQRHISEAV